VLNVVATVQIWFELGNPFQVIEGQVDWNGIFSQSLLLDLLVVVVGCCSLMDWLGVAH
jgi:hypothetical protein